MPESCRLGIFESVYKRPSLEQCFLALKGAGFTCVQFDLASVQIDPWSGPIDPHALESVNTVGAMTGVSISALSGTYNMAHPDKKVREAGLMGLQRIIEAAPKIGARFVTLCTGSRSTNSMWEGHESNSSAAAWQDSRTSIESALRTAEEAGIILLVEPEPANIVGTASLARRMLDDIDHPRLKIVLDPANIVLSDVSRSPNAVLSEAFELLGPDIVFAHAKDLSAEGEFCAAGTGIVPWRYYRSLLAGIDYRGDVIFHTLTESDVPGALAAWETT